MAAVICSHAGGGISTHRMNIRTHKPLTERYELFGTAGTLEISWGGPWRWSAYSAEPMDLHLYRAGRLREDHTRRPEQSVDLELSRSGHYVNELRCFLGAVRAGAAPPVDGAAGRAAVEVIVAAYLSAARGETVSLPLPGGEDVEGLFRRGAFGPR